VTTMLDWFYRAQSPEHADASPEAAEYLSHELIVRLQARPPSRLPCLVLGDGSVDLGFLDLLGGCAVPQGLSVWYSCTRTTTAVSPPRRMTS
jgi:hypothetical protein